MSAGATMIRPAYSKIASAPAKLAEYLGCGVPYLGNRDVGDVELILERNGCGVEAVRCPEAALTNFSHTEGAERYRSVYRSLAR